MPPPERQTPPGEGRGSQDTDHGQAVTIEDSSSVRYLRAREAVLGDRCTIPLNDPAGAFEAIVEALGGRQIAGAYAAQIVAEAGPHLWPIDPDGNRIDYAAIYEATS